MQTCNWRIGNGHKDEPSITEPGLWHFSGIFVWHISREKLPVKSCCSNLTASVQNDSVGHVHCMFSQFRSMNTMITMHDFLLFSVVTMTQKGPASPLKNLLGHLTQHACQNNWTHVLWFVVNSMMFLPLHCTESAAAGLLSCLWIKITSLRMSQNKCNIVEMFGSRSIRTILTLLRWTMLLREESACQLWLCLQWKLVLCNPEQNMF